MTTVADFALEDGKKLHQGWSPQCESNPSPSEEVWGVLKTTAIQDGAFIDRQNKELPSKLKAKPHLEVHTGDLLITCAGPRARCGVACLVRSTRGKLMISGKMYRFRADPRIVSPDYLELYLRSGLAQTAIDAMKTGSSESGLNLTQSRFKQLTVSFGPLEEQISIVAKVNELMALCDQLETARTVRETTRDKLTASALVRLSEPDPESFRDDADFALDNLPAIAARPDQIKQLRQTILNLAVRGKLVPQDSDDEPASELLKRIAGEKQRMRIKSASVPTGPALLLEPAPQGWTWTTLGDLILFLKHGVSERPDPDGVTPILRISAVRPLQLDPNQIRYLRSEIEDVAGYVLAPGDLLFTRYNGNPELVGACAVVPNLGRPTVHPDKIMAARVCGALPECIAILLSAGLSRAYIRSRGKTTAGQVGISGADLKSTPICLPPLGEQARIVTKVDELMALCDRLESVLSDTASTRRHLLEALLAESLEPSEEHIVSTAVWMGNEGYG